MIACVDNDEGRGSKVRVVSDVCTLWRGLSAPCKDRHHPGPRTLGSLRHPGLPIEYALGRHEAARCVSSQAIRHWQRSSISASVSQGLVYTRHIRKSTLARVTAHALKRTESQVSRRYTGRGGEPGGGTEVRYFNLTTLILTRTIQSRSSYLYPWPWSLEFALSLATLNCRGRQLRVFSCPGALYSDSAASR